MFVSGNHRGPVPAGAGGEPQGAASRLVSRSTVILNHTDNITDKDALAYLTERFTKVGAIVETMPFGAPGQRRDH